MTFVSHLIVISPSIVLVQPATKVLISVAVVISGSVKFVSLGSMDWNSMAHAFQIMVGSITNIVMRAVSIN